MKINRGLVVVTAILAGVIIGMFAGAYIYVTLVSPDSIYNNASPKQLHADTKGNTPQYRDFYVVRAANKYQNDVHINIPDPLQGAYDVLGLTTGDTTIDEAIDMVLSAEKVAAKENSVDGDAGQFSKNDELALGTLATALVQAKKDGRYPQVDVSKYPPLIARNTLRVVGLLVLLVLAALAFVVILIVDRFVNARSNPSPAPVRRTTGVQQPLVDLTPTPKPASQSAIAASKPTSPGLLGGNQLPTTVALGAGAETRLLTPPPTIYRHGDDHYEEAFAINGPLGELVGECGANIAERIGLGTPARVSALALWVFDKKDFPKGTKSATKILMSEFAWNDATIRDKLSAEGEVVQAQEGGVVEIMTSTLRVEVQVTDLSFGSDTDQPDSYFQRVTLTFNVFRRTP